MIKLELIIIIIIITEKIRGQNITKDFKETILYTTCNLPTLYREIAIENMYRVRLDVRGDIQLGGSYS